MSGMMKIGMMKIGMMKTFPKVMVSLCAPALAGFSVFHANFSHAQQASRVTTIALSKDSNQRVPARLPYVERMREVPADYFNRLESQPSSAQLRANLQHRPGFQPGADPTKTIIPNSATSRNWGTVRLEHTTAAVGGALPKLNTALASVPSTSPYNRTGKLYMVFSNSWGMCTASLVGKGVLVTAAHCLATYKRPNSYATQVYFVPSQYQDKGPGTPSKTNTNTAGPYGSWAASNFAVPTCYTSTGGCAQQATDAVGSNDIAIVLLANNQNNQLPRDVGIGANGYGWNGWGWNSDGYNALTQLGYPGALGVNLSTRGISMIRTDGQTVSFYGSSAAQKIHLWGSQQTPGCSGGPNILNFGNQPNITSPAVAGSFPSPNIITGVTSFGNSSIQRAGSSYFGQTAEFPNTSNIVGGINYGAGNIGELMAAACGFGGGAAAGKCF